MTEGGDESIRSRPPTLSDEPTSEVTDVFFHREDEHACKMFVAGYMPDRHAIRPSAFPAPDARLSIPTKHPDPSERDSKKLKTELPWGKGYVDKTKYLRADAIEPAWGWFEDPTISSEEREWLRRVRLEERLRISYGYRINGFSHAELKYEIFEIFSVSIHWNEKENVGGTQYHLYGNVFLDDCGGDCCLEAMKRSPQHPFIVSNGDYLPLRGLDRCLWCDPHVRLFTCLMGCRFKNGVKCCEHKTPVLIKKDLILVEDIKETFGSPVERTFAGADGSHFIKIHYSVMCAFVVGVEVRLVCPGENHFGKNKIRISGTLGVHWRHFENIVGGGLRDYTILLLDTEQQDSSEFTVRLGECFPIWRHKLAVPFDSECVLVFDADINTDSGEVFMGQKSICVEDNGKVFTLTFGGGMLNMQITLLLYFCG